MTLMTTPMVMLQLLESAGPLSLDEIVRRLQSMNFDFLRGKDVRSECLRYLSHEAFESRPGGVFAVNLNRKVALDAKRAPLATTRKVRASEDDLMLRDMSADVTAIKHMLQNQTEELQRIADSQDDLKQSNVVISGGVSWIKNGLELVSGKLELVSGKVEKLFSWGAQVTSDDNSASHPLEYLKKTDWKIVDRDGLARFFRVVRVIQAIRDERGAVKSKAQVRIQQIGSTSVGAEKNVYVQEFLDNYTPVTRVNA